MEERAAGEADHDHLTLSPELGLSIRTQMEPAAHFPRRGSHLTDGRERSRQ